MTRKERCDRLRLLWKRMPLNEWGFTDEQKFFAWQGMAAALLNYNSQLQSEFRDAIKSGPSQDYSLLLNKYKPMCDRIYAILSEAINELSIPEESPAPILTDEHGIVWFISHCTWSARLKLAGIILTVAGVVFFAGFRLGAIDRVRSLYIQWENSLNAQPTASPTPAQPRQ
jgi:hypothetical protein